MTEAHLDRQIEAVVEMIVHSTNIVVFTGAGISTESGIPDFRSPGGIWTRFDPEDFTIDKFLSSPETRRKQWRLLLETGLFTAAEPNRAHRAVADLEQLGRLRAVITQNVDNLHQKAGNNPDRVYELHGNMAWVKCLECSERYALESVLWQSMSGHDVPACEKCRGILKPDVIFFGEMLPPEVLRDAAVHARSCDLFIVIGSSLVVYPAAYMPVYAKEAGAKLVIINRDPTPFDADADVVLPSGAGDAMEKIMAGVRRRFS
jgi:NAD-dependent deacetylase